VRLRRARIAVIAVGFAALSGGCGGASGGHGPSPGSPSGFAEALAAVGDDPLSRQYLEYGDTPALRRLAGAPASIAELGKTQLNSRWVTVLGWGANILAARQTLGPTVVDSLAADRAVTVGPPARVAVRLDGPGIDGKAVEGALGRLGARRRQAQGLEFLALGRQNRAGPGEPAVPLGLPATVDRVVARARTVAAGSSERAAAVALGAGGGRLDRAPERAARGGERQPRGRRRPSGGASRADPSPPGLRRLPLQGRPGVRPPALGASDRRPPTVR